MNVEKCTETSQKVQEATVLEKENGEGRGHWLAEGKEGRTSWGLDFITGQGTTV